MSSSSFASWPMGSSFINSMGDLDPLAGPAAVAPLIGLTSLSTLKPWSVAVRRSLAGLAAGAQVGEIKPQVGALLDGLDVVDGGGRHQLAAGFAGLA